MEEGIPGKGHSLGKGQVGHWVLSPACSSGVPETEWARGQALWVLGQPALAPGAFLRRWESWAVFKGLGRGIGKPLGSPALPA